MNNSVIIQLKVPTPPRFRTACTASIAPRGHGLAFTTHKRTIHSVFGVYRFCWLSYIDYQFPNKSTTGLEFSTVFSIFTTVKMFRKRQVTNWTKTRVKTNNYFQLETKLKSMNVLLNKKKPLFLVNNDFFLFLKWL